MQNKELVIKQAYEGAIWRLDHSNFPDTKKIQKEIEDLRAMLLNETSPPDNFIEIIFSNNSGYVLRELMDFAFSRNHHIWSQNDSIIIALTKPTTERSLFYWTARIFIASKLVGSETEEEFENFKNFLYQQGYDDKEIISMCLILKSYTIFYKYTHTDNQPPQKNTTLFGHYLTKLLNSDTNKYNNYEILIEHFIFNEYGGDSFTDSALEFFYENYPECLEDKYEKYLVRIDNYDNQNKQYFIAKNALYLIEKNPEKFERLVVDLINRLRPETRESFPIYCKLNTTFPNKYDYEIEEIINDYYTQKCKIENNYGVYESSTIGEKGEWTIMSIAIAKYLIQKNLL